MPKVSVIMPSLNVEPYIRECMDSVVGQTLKDIEIICVDAGSTDGTLEILQEYAKQDSRIKIIVSDKRSYGYQMNIGIAAAKGEYIGIVETDDWVDRGMFFALYEAAVANDAEIVKSNYYWYTTTDKKSCFFENLRGCPYNEVFHPFAHKCVYSFTPSIWSGIYKRTMLERYHIKFNETKGAALQDTSFHFCIFSVATSVFFIEKAFFHYRKDNEGSSVNSQAKVFCVCEEMAYFEEFLAQHDEIESELRQYVPAWKFDKYMWNLGRINASFQWGFVKAFYEEFWALEKAGELAKAKLSSSRRTLVNLLLIDPRRFYIENGSAPLDPTVCFFDGTYNTLQVAQSEFPLVSIIIPVYNTERYVAECIKSITGQTLRNIEIICVDDGSTDDSLSVLVSHAKGDDRVTIVTQKNGGLSNARNTGLKHAHGEYVCFVDSDDMLVPTALAIMIAQAKNNDLDILYFDATSIFDSQELMTKQGRYYKAYSSKKVHDEIYTGTDYFCETIENKEYRVSACMQLIRHKLIEEEKLWFEPGITYEDNIFTYYSMLKAKRVQHINNKLYIRRIRSDSIMTSSIHLWNMYSYLVCFIKVVSFCIPSPLDERLDSCCIRRYDALKNAVREKYVQLNSFEKSRIAMLKKVDQYWLQMVLQQKQDGVVDIGEAGSVLASVSGHFLHRSYKIGCIITWLPRKIREGIRLLQQQFLRRKINT